jgi:hypothetical protein
MKLEVYEPMVEKEQVVRIKLVKEEGRVYLVAVNNYGATLIRGYLLRLTDGNLLRCSTVNPDLGFDLDEKGRIKFQCE